MQFRHSHLVQVLLLLGELGSWHPFTASTPHSSSLHFSPVRTGFTIAATVEAFIQPDLLHFQDFSVSPAHVHIGCSTCLMLLSLSSSSFLRPSMMAVDDQYGAWDGHRGGRHPNSSSHYRVAPQSNWVQVVSGTSVSVPFSLAWLRMLMAHCR